MNELTLKEKLKIEDMIYEIRGRQVILDSDLAKLYNVETKRINEAVKNNPLKFPERFTWKLSDVESKIFLVENFDQKIETRGGRFKNPRVFTETGVAMLSTILKSKIAIETSIAIMDAFIAMRHYISSNLLEQKYLNTMILKHENEINQNINDIKLLQESFNKLEENKEVNEIYFNGKIYDAYSKIIDIFKEAKKELIIIDRYTDKTILDMICNLNCKVILITGLKTKLTKLDILKYNQDYSNLKVVYNDTFHDRYFIIDKNKIYHSGNFLNHIGFRKSSIDVMQDDIVKKALLSDIKGIIK